MILHPKSIFLYIFCLVCVSRIFSQMAIKKLKKLDLRPALGGHIPTMAESLWKTLLLEIQGP